MRLDSYIFGCSRSKLIGTIAVLCAMVACSKEYPTIPGSGNRIGFEVSSSDCDWNKLKSGICIVEGYGGPDSLFLHTSISDRPSIIDSMTKGSIITEDDFYSSIGVHAFSFKGDWTEELTPNWMYNEEVTQESGWSTDFFWPSEIYNVRFFAYAPYNCDNLRLSQNSATGTPTFDYTIPNDVSEHKDIIVAASRTYQGNHSGTAELEFTHALTAVRFVAGNDMLPGKVTKVTLKGVFANGTYSYADNSWTPSGAYVSYSQEVDVNVDGIPGQPITAAEQTFMMLPQTLPSGAKIEINFIDDLTSQTHTLSASLAGTEWEPGKLVSYRISTSSISVVPVLTVEMPEFTHEGGTKTFYVTSHTTITSGNGTTTVAAPWTAEFVEEDGNDGYRTIEQPDWITSISLNGDGSTYRNAFSIAVKPQELTYETPHDEALRQAEPVYGIFDLSTNGGTETISTSNCYIVNAPGTYSFPLVYGNAIKNGAANPAAYTQPLSQLRGNFVNHRNAVITDPYIYNNTNCVPEKAIVSWQDSPELVNNIRLNGEKTEILFDVKQNTIKQGNAVISILDASNTIMWNWHIWVTDYKEGENLVTISTNSRDHEVMPFVVGFCFNAKQAYKERKATLRIKSDATDTYITLLQNGKSREWGHSTLYQWGVTCPMLPWSGKENATGDEMNKIWYDSDGNKHTENFPIIIGNNISNRIKNPVGIVSRFGNSYGSTSNMWNTALIYNAEVIPSYYTEETNRQIKTIYCPCPRKYTLMPFYLNLHIKKDYHYISTDRFYYDYDLNGDGSKMLRLYNIHGRDIERDKTTNEYTAPVNESANNTIWTSQYRMTIANISHGACDEISYPVMAIKEQ